MLRLRTKADSPSQPEGEWNAGLTHVTVRVADLAKKGTPFEAEFLVDTGAVDCLAPAELLQAAGIAPIGKEVYELANGKTEEYEYAFAWLTILGHETVAQILFGPAGCEPLLGVIALESIGVVVDPMTKNLKRLHAKPLK